MRGSVKKLTAALLSCILATALASAAGRSAPALPDIALSAPQDTTTVQDGDQAGEGPLTAGPESGVLSDSAVSTPQEGDQVGGKRAGKTDKKDGKDVKADKSSGKEGKGSKAEDKGAGKKHGKKGGETSPTDTTTTTDTLRIGDFGDIYIENLLTGGDAGPIYTDEYLDTVKINRKIFINDYTMVGIQYGVGLNRMSWNPSMGQTWQFKPVNFGVTYTRYGKIFGYMPYFGLQVGLFYGQEGYKLDEGYNVQGAREVTMNIVEFTPMAHCHFDFWKMKLIVNIGPYVSYRLDINRSGDYALPPALINSFLSTDRRWDYGIKGGGGFGLMFDPIEIHFEVMYKFGFGLLYDPAYYSEYYYRFSTVSNLIMSVGVHFQLTKRTGKGTHQLRKEAREVYLQRKYGTEE